MVLLERSGQVVNRMLGRFDAEWRYELTAVDMVVDLTDCVVYATATYSATSK